MATSTSKKSVKGAATKKAATKKPGKSVTKTAKSATTKSTGKTIAKKVTAKDVVLTATMTKQVDIIGRDQERLEKAAHGMIKVANDIGERLIKLRDDITKKYGRVWKAWAQTPGNLPIGYEMVTRYMKLAGATDEEFEKITATSVEDAVKQIEHIRKPEKAEAAAKAKAEKAEKAKADTATGKSRKTATDGIITNATLDEIERCTDIKELRNVITLCHARIEELEQQAMDPIDGKATVIEDDEGSDADDQADIEVALS